MKVVVDLDTKEILGAAILGTSAATRWSPQPAGRDIGEGALRRIVQHAMRITRPSQSSSQRS